AYPPIHVLTSRQYYHTRSEDVTMNVDEHTDEPFRRIAFDVDQEGVIRAIEPSFEVESPLDAAMVATVATLAVEATNRHPLHDRIVELVRGGVAMRLRMMEAHPERVDEPAVWQMAIGNEPDTISVFTITTPALASYVRAALSEAGV